MRTEPVQVTLVFDPPDPEVPWVGKLMAIRQGGILHLPLAFCREGIVPPLHREILEQAGFRGAILESCENLGGCLLEVFMGTVILWGSSEDFGPLKDQAVLVPQVDAELRRFLHRMEMPVSDIDTEGLHSY